MNKGNYFSSIQIVLYFIRVKFYLIIMMIITTAHDKGYNANDNGDDDSYVQHKMQKEEKISITKVLVLFKFVLKLSPPNLS